MTHTDFSISLANIVGGRVLDANNISWRKINEEWIGKRAVCTFDLRHVWLEETEPQNVKRWLHGEEADYNETFNRICR